MGQITSLYVYKVVSQASEGVETRDLVEDLGLDPDGPIDPARMVSSEDYYRFFARLEERDPEGLALPWRIGGSMRADEYGAFGLAWKSAPDLRGSFSRAERYGRVLSSVEVFELERVEDGAFLTLHKEGDGSRGMLLSNEASIAAVRVMCAQVSAEPFRAKAIHFMHAPRGDVAAYEAHFGCPVHFGEQRDAVLVSEDTLTAPNLLGDATIAGFFDRHLEQELASIEERQTLDGQVKTLVANALSEGVPTVSSIASDMGMSARTLQRRLSDEGFSFQGLVDAARQGLAKQLLCETDYGLAEIAFLTGFSEQSAFTRAFKRWAGQTPGSFRKA
ncbi:AraC family transcriptional regulator [Sphingomicrobium sediminis]|uniref:AraC family transcriptional regulator n=1 Tax=Sphingomicrobium sediminis TaxID=2950949 RepID=A0A9X2EHS6_9SPHN|nr:AraC family transcriptional regulator [Sphingomicrobium sediminis]MCM8558273.1 AraC family transcriptional regulator [Sphingomicrobium sediminis]